MFKKKKKNNGTNVDDKEVSILSSDVLFLLPGASNYWLVLGCKIWSLATLHSLIVIVYQNKL